MNEGAAGEQEQAKGGKSKIIIIVLALLVLITGSGVVAAMLLLGGEKNETQSAEEEAALEKEPALYLAMKPPFVSNYSVGSRQRYLQIELTLVTRDEDNLTIFDDHMPMIRNDIVSLLSQQNFEELRDPDGKEALRINLLEALKLKLEEETGEPTVEDLLFTSFVMQ